MKLSPFMKQVEIEGGYKGFYRYGSKQVSVTVEENGIGIYVDTRSGIPMDRGVLKRLFKPMTSLWAGRQYVENFGEPNPESLETMGFVELSSVEL